MIERNDLARDGVPFDADGLKEVLNSKALPEWQRDAFLAEMRWQKRARAKQIAPPGDWEIWMLRPGRGFGKTESGANWVRQIGLWNEKWEIPCIAATDLDLRKTMFGGKSGLLANIPPSCIEDYNKSYHELILKSGTKIYGFSAVDPDRLRGPNSNAGWLDELAAYKQPDEVWDQYNMTLRDGEWTQTCVTTTPRPLKLIKELDGYSLGKRPRDWSPDAPIPKTVVVRGSSRENLENLSKNFKATLMRYDGTDKGRQEIDGDIIDLSATAPLKSHWWKGWTEPKLPTPEKILISLDTAEKDEDSSDPTACTVWAVIQVPVDITLAHLDYPDRKTVKHGHQWIAVLVDAWSEKLAFPELKKQVKETYRFWCKRMKYNPESDTISDPPVELLIEDKSSGVQLCQEFRAEGIAVTPYKIPGNSSKRERADVASDMLKDGLIWAVGKYLPEEGLRDGSVFVDFGEDVRDECANFTGEIKGEADHYVDTCTQAWTWLRRLGYLVKRGDVNPKVRRRREDEELDERMNRGAERRNPYG